MIINEYTAPDFMAVTFDKQLKDTGEYAYEY